MSALLPADLLSGTTLTVLVLLALVVGLTAVYLYSSLDTRRDRALTVLRLILRTRVSPAERRNDEDGHQANSDDANTS